MDCTTRSRPRRAGGRARDCTGEGRANPALATPRRILSARPRSEKDRPSSAATSLVRGTEEDTSCATGRRENVDVMMAAQGSGDQGATLSLWNGMDGYLDNVRNA